MQLAAAPASANVEPCHADAKPEKSALEVRRDALRGCWEVRIHAWAPPHRGIRPHCRSVSESTSAADTAKWACGRISRNRPRAADSNRHGALDRAFQTLALCRCADGPCSARQPPSRRLRPRSAPARHLWDLAMRLLTSSTSRFFSSARLRTRLPRCLRTRSQPTCRRNQA